MKRYEIQVDDLEIEPDAIFDTKTKTLYECRSSDMNELCKLLNKEDTKWQKLKEWLIQIIKVKGNSPKYYKLNDVLEKMQELGGEDESL